MEEYKIKFDDMQWIEGMLRSAENFLRKNNSVMAFETVQKLQEFIIRLKIGQ